MNKFIALIFAFILNAGLLSDAFAGVIVGGTRLVYDANKRETSITVRNPDKDVPYLIQSWLTFFDESDAIPPFFITPPLFRLDGEQENVIRIMLMEDVLPEDKESIFWLNIKSIPSTKKTDKNQLLISVKTQIKFFYRPKALDSESAAAAYRQLNFSLKNNLLTINNPTPYFVSFFSLKVGNHKVKENLTAEPFGEMRVKVPASASGKVSWQAINDYGGITKEEIRQL